MDYASKFRDSSVKVFIEFSSCNFLQANLLTKMKWAMIRWDENEINSKK